MSGEMMNFPDTAEEFMEQYKIVDSEEVYTNGAELVPIFRMEQWFEQHPEPHWIPVTERLPEENYLDDGYVEPSQYVLVYMSYHVCKVSRYWGHRKTKGTSDYIIPDWMDLEEHDGDNVLAWMPKPEPYKGG